jgi:hypothetical protein
MCHLRMGGFVSLVSSWNVDGVVLKFRGSLSRRLMNHLHKGHLIRPTIVVVRYPCIADDGCSFIWTFTN